MWLTIFTYRNRFNHYMWLRIFTYFKKWNIWCPQVIIVYIKCRNYNHVWKHFLFNFEIQSYLRIVLNVFRVFKLIWFCTVRLIDSVKFYPVSFKILQSRINLLQSSEQYQLEFLKQSPQSSGCSLSEIKSNGWIFPETSFKNVTYYTFK